MAEISWEHHRKPRIYRHRGLLTGARHGRVLLDSTDREYDLERHCHAACEGPPVPAGTFRGLSKTGAPSTYLHPATGAQIRRFTRFAGDLTGTVEWHVTWPGHDDICDVVATLEQARSLCERAQRKGVGIRYRALPVTLGSADTVARWLDAVEIDVFGLRSSQRLVIPDNDTETAVALIAGQVGPHAPPVEATVAAYREPQDESSLHTKVTRALTRGPRRFEVFGLDSERHRLPDAHRPVVTPAEQSPWERLWELRDKADEDTFENLFAVVRHHEAGGLSTSAALARMEVLVQH